MSTRDPAGIDQHTSGAKLDGDKIDMSLLSLLGPALTEVCRVMDYGQTKYTRGGFLDVADAENRYSAAMLRHYFSTDMYDDGDPFYDSPAGLPFKGKIRHDAQVAVNALFRLQIILAAEAEEEEALLSTLENLVSSFAPLDERGHGE